ncbi:Glycosyltransferase involved in cell wall bisynthesis [Dyadobacter sp. SG02]|uniref:glycosyltransferase family 1 protein n=1 Tax=Dyadobacter sp. SG02 TaxID=1855291 RepID=UPI0008ADB616|nr:glycosyltransferase family 1 protein [Dyadobacter sp. SG02]SEJ38788.1 Glycosyltransferase involved in cell wall bisynthesis [Dyadobacter sp. SG02]
MNINLQKDLLCFSHLRWDFVFQRPQHLMTRFAQHSNVYFLEEPFLDAPDKPFIQFERKLPGLWLCVPHLPADSSPDEVIELMKGLLHSFFEGRDSSNFIFWYYTPMAFEFSRDFKSAQVVYDCMDELSAFKFAPARIKFMEQQLFTRADIVFTGGVTLYEAKKESHSNVHPFPSSIDKEHFQTARGPLAEPWDQAGITGTKVGFYGVIDERFDQDLIREIAAKRPDWQIILIGPVVKIDPAMLPRAGNIHYLGSKSYQELPAYLSGWNVALIPFLLNESTQFISPTKTPEYLAAGRPVVSSGIRDVIDPYSKANLVSIAQGTDEFISAIDYELGNFANPDWLQAVDEFLSDKSWQNTFSAMLALMQSAKSQKKEVVLTGEMKNAS